MGDGVHHWELGIIKVSAIDCSDLLNTALECFHVICELEFPRFAFYCYRLGPYVRDLCLLRWMFSSSKNLICAWETAFGEFRLLCRRLVPSPNWKNKNRELGYIDPLRNGFWSNNKKTWMRRNLCWEHRLVTPSRTPSRTWGQLVRHSSIRCSRILVDTMRGIL